MRKPKVTFLDLVQYCYTLSVWHFTVVLLQHGKQIFEKRHIKLNVKCRPIIKADPGVLPQVEDTLTDILSFRQACLQSKILPQNKLKLKKQNRSF